MKKTTKQSIMDLIDAAKKLRMNHDDMSAMHDLCVALDRIATGKTLERRPTDRRYSP